MKKFVTINRIQKANIIGVLGLLFVLSACATAPMKVSKKGLFDRDASQASVTPEALYTPKEGEKVILTGKWQWPIASVEISSPFGQRGRKFHQGIDMRAHVGTPVHAASDGEVVYVGSKIRGYGRMVVIKHPNDIYSVYAHHSKNLVKVGRHVKRGDLIAMSGRSGHVSGPHLHFEIRKGTQSFDPEYSLNQNIRSYALRSTASDKVEKKN